MKVAKKKREVKVISFLRIIVGGGGGGSGGE